MTKQNISARFISAIKRGYRGIFSCINLVQLFFVTKKEAKLKSQERAVESELKQIKKKSGVKGAQFEKAHTYFYTKSIKHIRTWRRYKPTTKVALVGGMVVLLVASSLSLNLLFNGTGKAANPERAFEQQVELLNKAITISSSGAYATVGSAAGMSVSLDYSSYFLYTASNYSNAKFYFESVLASSSGTAYVSLFTKAGVQVAVSEVSTSSTTDKRVRSAEITSSLVDGTEYRFKVKGSATVQAARIVVDQSSTTGISATETHFALAPLAEHNEDSWALIDNNRSQSSGFVEHRVYYYDSSKYDGNVSIFFEATGASNYYLQSFKLKLYDVTAGADVANSTVTLPAAGTVEACPTYYACPALRGRAAISLVSGHEYAVMAMRSGAATAAVVDGAEVVIVQKGEITKLQTPRYLNSYLSAYPASASFDYTAKPTTNYWDTTVWKASSISLSVESAARVYQNPGQMYVRITDDGVAVPGTELAFTYNSFARLRSSAFAPPSTSSEIGYQLKLTINTTGTYYDISNVLYLVDINIGLSEVTFGSISGQSTNCKGGETCTINWTYAGSLDHLDLKYSLDGSNWLTLADSVPVGNAGAGSYAWAVPYIIQSDSAQIKANGYDASDSFLLTALSSNFVIEAGRGPKNIEQTINLFGSSFAASAPSWTGIEAAIINFNPANYPDGTVFLEAVMSTSSAGSPAYLSLSDSGVTAPYLETQISTTSTSLTRVRSNPLSINGEYSVTVKCDATITVQSVRLIVIQSAQTISKTETHIDMSGKYSSSTYPTAYANLPSSKTYYYDSTKVDGTVQAYFEVTNKIANGYSRADTYLLYDKTASAVVANSTVGIASLTLNRARSSALTLTTGHEYIVRYACLDYSSVTEVLNSARLIIVQTGFANSEIMMPLDSFSGTTSTGSYVTQKNNYLFEPDNWQGVKKKYFAEASFSSASGTGYVDFTSAGTSITSAAVSTASTTIARVRSVEITANMPTTAQIINTKWKSGASTLTINGSWIVVQVNLGVNIGGTISGSLVGRKVSVSVNKGIPQSVTSTAGGAFLFNQVSIDPNSMLVIYLDDQAEKGNIVTQSLDEVTPITGLVLYPGRVVIQHHTAGPITNALLVANAYNDSDVLFSGSGTTITFASGGEVYVLAGKSYVPGGTTNFDGINIPASGTLTMGANAFSIKGSLTLAASSNFTYSGTLTFDGTGTQALSLASGTLATVLHNGSGTLQLGADLAITGDFENRLGALDFNSYTLSVAGNFANTGTYTGSGTLAFTKATGTQTLNAGGSGLSMPNLSHTGAGTLQLATTNLAVAGNILNSAGTLALNSNNVSLGGNWTNTASVTTGTAVVTFNSTANTQTINPGASSFYSVTITNSTAGGVVFNASTTITETLTSTDSAVKKLTFLSGGTFSVKNLSLLGTSGLRLVLTGSTTSAWNLTNLSGTLSVSYVDVSYSSASAVIGAPQSRDSGNNTNWSFVSEIQVTGLPGSAKVNSNIPVTVVLKDGSGGNVSSVLGNVTLAVNYGTITPTTLTNANFGGGSWSGNLVLDKVSRAADSNLTTITITNNSVTWTGQVNITPGDLADFILDTSLTLTSEIAVQAPFTNVSVTAVDAWGNVKTNYTGNVYFESNDVSASFPYTSAAQYTFVNPADMGSHTFGQQFKFMTPGASRTFSVTNGTISKQITVKVTPAALGSFTVVGMPESAVAGIAFSNIAVTALDIYGNIKDDYVGQTWFTSTDVNGSVVLPATSSAKYSFTVGDAGQKTFNNFKLITAGSQNITFTNGTVGLNKVSPITVSPAALDRFTLTGSPASTQANVAFADPIVVTAYDQYNNQKTDYAGSVNFASNDTKAVLPYTSASKYTFIPADNGSHSFTGITLKTTGTKTLDIVDGSISASVNVLVTPGVLAGYTMTGVPETTPAGTAFNNITVTALDICDNVKTDYLGQVWFETSDANPSVVLPNEVTSKYTYTVGDAGVHVFNGFNLMTTGDQALKVKGSEYEKVANLTVSPAALKSFTLVNTTTDTMAGESFGTMTVTAIDTFDNIKTDYTGQGWFTSSDVNGSVVLPYTTASKYTYNLSDAGVKVFDNFKLITTGSQTITFTNGQGGIANQTTTIDVAPAALNRLTITSSPASTQANVPFTDPIIVTAYDQYNNQKTNYTGSVHFTSSDDKAVLPYTPVSKYTFIPGDNGSHSFTGFNLKTTGMKSLDVVDSAASVTGTVNISVSPGVLASFMVSGTMPSTTVAGQSFASPANNLTVTALDDCNNIKTDYIGPVWFETSDTSASVSLPATVASKYTYTTGAGKDNGVHVFAGNTFALITQTTTGHSITLLSDLGASKNVSVANSIKVSAAAFNHFSLEDYPQAPDQWATSGEDWSRTEANGGDNAPYDVTVSARDIYNNIKSDFTGPVWFSMQNGVVYTFANTDAESAYTFTSDGGATRENKESAYDNGKHIFEAGNFVVNTSGSNLAFTVNTTEVSNNFQIKVKPGDVASVNVTFSDPFSSIGTESDPLIDLVGNQLTSSVTATAYDLAGNVKTDYQGGYYFSSSDPEAVLPYTESNHDSFGELDQGSKTLSPGSTANYFKFNTGGNQVISAYVQAKDGSWKRGDSTTFTISTHKPINVSATAGHRQVTLDWQNPVDQAVVKVAIYQSTASGTLGSRIALVDVAPSVFSQYNAINLDNGSTYYFTLKAVTMTYNSNPLESLPSEQVSATPADLAARNVSAVMLLDGRVKVDYSLRYTSEVGMQYYKVDTRTWVDASSSALSGSCGPNQYGSESIDRHTFYWLARSDYPNKYYSASEGFKVRVKVYVSQSTAFTPSSSFMLDTQPPSSLSVVVDASKVNVANLKISASDNPGNTIQMKLSTNADFSGASWQGYSTTINDWPIGENDKFYAKFVDSYSNESDLTVDVIPVLENFAIKDVSDTRIPAYQFFLSWGQSPINNIKNYIVERAVNDGDFVVSNQSAQLAFVDLGLTDKNFYSYRVKVEDQNGSISRPSIVLSSQPGLAPNVTSKPTVQVFGYKQEVGVKAIVKWKTDQYADSFVAYSTDSLKDIPGIATVSGVNANIYGQLDRVLEHEVVLTGLQPGKKYYMKSLSQNDIKITGYSDIFEIDTPPYTALEIKNLSFKEQTPDSVWVSWNTNKLSTTQLYYGVESRMDRNVQSKTLNTDHTFKLENLEAGATYKLRIQASDEDGNMMQSDEYAFYPPAKPVVTNVQYKDVTYHTATVSWETNVPCASTVEYGDKPDYGYQSSKPELVTKHEINLVGLADKIQYNFRVVSKDIFGNVAKSDNKSFVTDHDTAAPVITDVQSQLSQVNTPQGMKYQAVISWKTDEGSTSQIEYGENSAGNYTKKTKEDTSLNMNHVVILSDLKANGAFSYRVKSRDMSGNEAVSSNFTIVTPPQERSLIQIVLNSLSETFSWASRLKEWVLRR